MSDTATDESVEEVATPNVAGQIEKAFWDVAGKCESVGIEKTVLFGKFENASTDANEAQSGLTDNFVIQRWLVARRNGAKTSESRAFLHRR